MSDYLAVWPSGNRWVFPCASPGAAKRRIAHAIADGQAVALYALRPTGEGSAVRCVPISAPAEATPEPPFEIAPDEDEEV